jgi:hypothetical protein
MPSATSAPDDAMVPTIGMPKWIAWRIARSSTSPSGGPIAPTCLPPSIRNVLIIRPSGASRRLAEAVELR